MMYFILIKINLHEKKYFDNNAIMQYNEHLFPAD